MQIMTHKRYSVSRLEVKKVELYRTVKARIGGGRGTAPPTQVFVNSTLLQLKLWYQIGWGLGEP